MKVVNKREMASILGVTERTLSEWQKLGLPFVRGKGRGSSNHYQTPKVIEWMVAREVSQTPAGESARDRHARLQGDVLEITLAEKRRELIPAAEVEPEWNASVVAARQALLTVPLRVAPLLSTMGGSVDAIRELLAEAISDALTRLANDDESGAPGHGEAGPPSVGAATADPAVRLGGAVPRAS